MSIKGLLHYNVFFITLIVGTISASIITAIIFYNDVWTSNINACGTSKCFSYFVDLFSFPIDILKATVALLAIAALLHKSEETQVQISIAESQNTYNNFFHHRDMVYKEISESISKSEQIKLVDFNKIYKLLFPLNGPDNFKTEAEFCGVNKIFEQFFLKTFKHAPLRSYEKYKHPLDDLDIVNKAELTEKIDENLDSMFNLLGFSLELDADYIDINNLSENYPKLDQDQIELAEHIKVSPLIYYGITQDITSISEAINRVAFLNSPDNKLSFRNIGSETLRVNFKIANDFPTIWMHISQVKMLVNRKLIIKPSTR